MTKVSFPTDAITLKDISTGGSSAGNGGDGYNKGDIINAPSINFNPYNKADGADAHVNTGDKVDKGYWDAGSANATAHDFSKAYDGHANSTGDQSGHDTSSVNADTTVNQINVLAADMGQQVAAGIGGNGGNDNYAKAGDFESTNLNDVGSTHYTIDDFTHH